MASRLASAMQQPAGRGLHSEGPELRGYSDASAAALPFAQLLANAASGGSDWKVQPLCTHSSIHASILGRSCHLPVLCHAHDQASLLLKACMKLQLATLCRQQHCRKN